MTEHPKWRRLLEGVPRTLPGDGNVVPLAISLDAIEREIIQLTNELVTFEAEAERVAMGWSAAHGRLISAQTRLAEHVRPLGIKAEVVERKLNTLPVRDQVSLAAAIMAKHARRGRVISAADRSAPQLDLSSS